MAETSEQRARELSYESYVCIKSHGDECKCCEQRITTALRAVEAATWEAAAEFVKGDRNNPPESEYDYALFSLEKEFRRRSRAQGGPEEDSMVKQPAPTPQEVLEKIFNEYPWTFNLVWGEEKAKQRVERLKEQLMTWFTTHTAALQAEIKQLTMKGGTP